MVHEEIEQKIRKNLNPEWLDGWSKAYEKGFDTNLKELNRITIHYPIQLISYYIEEQIEGKKALDLATGNGRVACFLAQLGFDVMAIDALKTSVELTKKRAKALGVSDKVKVKLGDIETFQLRQEGYDLVAAMQCLQYLRKNAQSRLLELKKAVRTGGFLVYSGNVKPHFDTNPPIKPYFIAREDLRDIFENWTIFSLGKEERLMKENDRRGYTWIVAKNERESDDHEIN
jgi:2-polyprenyl-3-methyl-5-hydroxy-6-metoxy-1,4-benzoquinol methylase